MQGDTRSKVHRKKQVRLDKETPTQGSINSTHFGNPEPAQENTRGPRKLQIAASVATSREHAANRGEPRASRSSVFLSAAHWTMVYSYPLVTTHNADNWVPERLR